MPAFKPIAWPDKQAISISSLCLSCSFIGSLRPPVEPRWGCQRGDVVDPDVHMLLSASLSSSFFLRLLSPPRTRRNAAPPSPRSFSLIVLTGLIVKIRRRTRTRLPKQKCVVARARHSGENEAWESGCAIGSRSPRRLQASKRHTSPVRFGPPIAARWTPNNEVKL